MLKNIFNKLNNNHRSKSLDVPSGGKSIGALGVVRETNQKSRSKKATIEEKPTTTNNNNKSMIDSENATPTTDHHHQEAAATIKQLATNRLISRTGRKRLSAMISRLQSSMSIQPKSTDNNNTRDCRDPNDHDNNNDDDDDDDDDDYKSAEEMCPMDRSGDGYASGRGASRVISTHNKPQDCFELLTDSGKDELFMPEEDCDIPTFLRTENCAKHLIDQTRVLLRERYVNNPDSFYDSDYKRMLSDDWTVSRFLLRRRLEPRRAAKLMEECGRFRKQYKMSEVKLWEFPIEFHKAGGLFKYAPDRVGNMTLYMRVKMYRRVPEISDVFKAFILCVLEECDVENNGRGTAIIFDLSGCGLQNVDLGFLSWLLSSFRNYCPKGVSYIIVYNLPWILNATCKLAMGWMSDNNRRSLRFAHGKEIENFIANENLPDYCGGSCKINYRAIPKMSRPAIEVCEQLDISQKQALKIKELFKEYLDDDDDDADDENDNDADSESVHSCKRKGSLDCQQDVDSISLANSTGDGTLDAHVATDASQQQQPAPITLPPVVGLVSRASKFIAH